MYYIEKGIPIPEAKRQRKHIYPFEEMKVGDSFLVPKMGKKRHWVQSCYKVEGMKFAQRTVKGGVRVWRIQ